MSPALSLAPGTVFASDYKVVRALQSGGQGSLYVVEQLSTTKQRVLKLLLPELVAEPVARRRFEQEAKITAKIPSDHVVETIAAGIDATTGMPWLVMELLEGEDLAAYLQKKKFLPASEVLEILDQMCHALGEAHKLGIVHRDIKPENIFLATPKRRGVPFMVKLLDFGIARMVAEVQTHSGATRTGLGTPMWMAPEQTVPGGPLSPATDVWPLGLITFRLLTGYLFWKSPYSQDASVMMMMAEAFMHPMPTASQRATEYNCLDRLPPDFDTWFGNAVVRDMQKRFPNAAAAFEALEPILRAASEKAPPPSTERPSKEPAEKPVRTGPELRTWEGAPVLPESAVLSVEVTGAPPSAEPRSSKAPSGEVLSAKEPSKPTSRTPLLAGLGLIALVSLGVGIKLLLSDPPGPRGAGAKTLTATASPSNNAPPAASTAAVAPTDSASAAPPSSDSAEPPSDMDASAGSWDGGSRSRGKLCKPVGAKCFSHSDCCEGSCKLWTCKSNPALKDPYGE